MTVLAPAFEPVMAIFFNVLLVTALSQAAPFCKMAESEARFEMIAVSPLATATVIRPVAATKVHWVAKGVSCSSTLWKGSSLFCDD